MAFEIKHGDCLEVMRGMPDNSVDAVVTDPPYGLSFMGKKWDYDVPSVEVWAECLRVLKPGGHLLAFAGTRTQHRMAVRIEDAGFEIRDMIAWVYGSGFPKSLDVSKAIDKAEGAERQVVGSKLGQPGYSLAKGKPSTVDFGPQSGDPEMECAITVPATEAARQWAGWGTALKPALEPITVARKPLVGTVAENVLEHGTGALNIDACRVGDFQNTTPSGVDRRNAKLAELGYRPGEYQMGEKVPNTPPGRWPANLIHDGSEEVVGMFPDAKAGVAVRSNSGGNTFGGNNPKPAMENMGYGDTGSAARFFKTCEHDEAASASRLVYCAKASKKDRDEGLEGFVERDQRELAAQQKTHTRVREDGSIGVNPYLGNTAPKRNHHPTVKPTDLMRYLCRLVTPPGGTVLDPFTGSGSTGKAAVLEGFNFIGIEREAEYVAIAEARIVEAQKSLGLFA